MDAGESFQDLNAGTTLPAIPMAKHTAAQTMETASINVRTSLAPDNSGSYPICYQLFSIFTDPRVAS